MHRFPSRLASIFVPRLAHIIMLMAKRSSQLLALFLLLGLTAVWLPGQAASPMQAQTVPEAGCHQHGAKPPVPAPSNYRCCQLGHNSAILQSSLTAQSFLVVLPGDSSSSLAVISVDSVPGGAAVLLPNTPHIIPLRV
jgi:hypothetical protein